MRITLPHWAAHPRLRRVAVVAAAVTLGTGLLAVVATQASAAAGCTVNYQVVNAWPGNFQGNIVITNLGDQLTSWSLGFTFTEDQKITQLWSGKFTQSGKAVTVTNESYNGTLARGGTANPGFLATVGAVNTVPKTFTLNGVACTGTVPTSQPPTTAPPTTTPPTTQPPTTPPPTTQPPTSPPPTGPRQAHVDNPYAGVKGYVNPDWKAKADAEPGGSRVSNNPTGVWLDSIKTITAPSGSGYARSLRAHLDAALAQGAGYAQFVIYDLPGRDCAALASNGELGPTEIARYQAEYIDPIVAVMGDIKYANLRIINVIEIDSLPNLVTNAGSQAGATDACRTMLSNGNYVTGIRYALSKLHAIGSNIYNYIDAAHHGWLGWDSNFGPAGDLFASTVSGATGGWATVDGFISNTANYSALTEPYFTINTSVNGTTVRQSKWVDWNWYVDELTFAQAFRTQMISKGAPSSIGMLIDTGRNGWGGTARPTGPSTSTDVNTFVDQSRIDRRIHAGNWCNQVGAGLGERPRAAPSAGIDAYVWIKPPGESDGSSSAIPNDQGKGFDRMCDPTYTGNARNGNSLTGAMPNAPLSGAWFSQQFQDLMKNAYPAL